ncbi:glycoside hydrolase family 2 [Marinilabiliaceae bacterium JC017]|nr:glycoside hydrolase family 2 [Marinilabiliaceae bacterium JC017]
MKNRILLLDVVIFLVIVLQLSCTRSHVNEVDLPDMNANWQLQSSEMIKVGGAELSSPDCHKGDWYNVQLPSTVLNALIENKEYKDVFFGENLKDIDAKRFETSWWYRKTFNLLKKEKDAFYRLKFEGVNYKANIWCNGKLIADENTIEGAFGMWELDVTEMVRVGENALAVEIIPPVRGDLTIGFVDWNPAAPDNNMGLWRGVKFLKSKAVSVSSPYVHSKVSSSLQSAELSVSVLVRNHSGKKESATVEVAFEGIKLNKEVTIESGEEKNVIFDVTGYPQLALQQPKLWWPNNLGEPYLYDLSVKAFVNRQLSDALESRFGIREIEQYLTEEGHKGYKVNGRKILIKGGGWVDDMLLADSDEKVRAQVEYARHMNLNCIRLEGFWGRNKTLYDAADENGMLLMIGWSCHWEWEAYCGRPEDHYMSVRTPEDMELQASGYRDQVKWLRQHPSIFLWVYGSDKLPLPDLERKLNSYIKALDPGRSILAGCKYQDFGTEVYNVSEVSGPTGVKMLGPYAYVPPVYWYIDTIAGGAYGFNTETGPGPQVPPMESIRKMIPQEHLWPVDEVWNYHCGRHEFGSLDRYMRAFDARYGKASNVEEFVFKSQMSNYEAIRPMFEAFRVNKDHATGVIQWMLNSAWPEMFWQLYDYYLMPNGAFYGTQKACQPLSPVYNYKDNGIYVVNDLYRDVDGLKITIRLLDINSKELFKETKQFTARENSSQKIMAVPPIPALSKTYFIDLKLHDASGDEVAGNFYWLSTKEDVLDFEKTRWVYTPTKSFANLKGINTLPEVNVKKQFNQSVEGDYRVFTCELTNSEPYLAFFIEVAVVDKSNGETIVPVFWNDNYVSLLPGEKKVLKAKIHQSLLKGKETEVRVKGWNLKK